jgi:PAS domain S-box-containing protein
MSSLINKLKSKKRIAFGTAKSKFKNFEKLNKSDDAILLLETATGKIIDINQAIVDLTGYSRYELLNQPLSIISYHYQDPVNSYLSHKLKQTSEDIPLIFEWEIKTKSGNRLFVVVSLIIPCINSGNELIVLLHEINACKITEQALDKSEANFRTIINNTEIAFLLIDTSGDIIAKNIIADRWSHLSFGTSLQEGVNLFSLINPDRKNKLLEHINKVLNGNSIDFETDYPNQDKSVVWYRIRMSPIYGKSQQIIGMCISASNITQRKLLQFEQTKITEDLIQQNKNLEQFSYIVSHNLRSPIVNIVGLTDVLMNNEFKADDNDFLIKELSIAAKRLDNIIIDLNHILHIKKIGAEVKETISFSSIIDDVSTSLQNIIQKEGVQIITNFSSWDTLITVKGYMYSIFYNLITNSIKYRQPDKKSIIEITSHANGQSHAIMFKDNGIGIDLAKNGDKVFGMYNRFHSNIEGKGLGLFMVKTQVEALGGKISIKSEINRGTEFKIEFEIN